MSYQHNGESMNGNGKYNSVPTEISGPAHSPSRIEISKNGINQTLDSNFTDLTCSPMTTSTRILRSSLTNRSSHIQRPHTIEPSDGKSLRVKRNQNLLLEKNDEMQPLKDHRNGYYRSLSFGDADEAMNSKHDLLPYSENGTLVKLRDDGGHGRKNQGNGKANTNGTDYLLEKKVGLHDEPNSLAMSFMYAMINIAVVLPVIMSFGSIIYHDPFFRPYLPILIKLTVISGMIHQVTFSTFSTLPFAVGQVQDAGLIFLSAIAADIVRYCQERGYDDDHILATCTVGLSLCTAILGVSLIIIAKMELVSVVQKLPTSVVGGYLAFIGFFCGQAGMSLMSDVEVSGVLEWNKFLAPDAFILLFPGVFAGFGIYFLVKYIKHASVLPICIVAIVLFFYSTLSLTGTSLEQARADGWINQGDAPPVWYHSWDYLRFEKVVWSALPSQTFTLISMILVVALSSSLDVAAIELDLGRPLDYNREIKTVGISNILSGITGGYTGSYIFSQTIFSMRSGITSRWCGYIIAIVEFISVILPFSILSYLPNFFFGSLLVMICVDLLWEWLWDVRDKVTQAEYAIAWSTFILIQILGVEYGILAGVVLYFIGKKLGYDMGAECDDLDESVDSKTFYIDAHGGSLMNFFAAFKSQLSLAASNLSLSSMFNTSNEGNENQNSEENKNPVEETDETLMV